MAWHGKNTMESEHAMEERKTERQQPKANKLHLFPQPRRQRRAALVADAVRADAQVQQGAVRHQRLRLRYECACDAVRARDAVRVSEGEMQCARVMQCE